MSGKSQEASGRSVSESLALFGNDRFHGRSVHVIDCGSKSRFLACCTRSRICCRAGAARLKLQFTLRTFRLNQIAFFQTKSFVERARFDLHQAAAQEHFRLVVLCFRIFNVRARRRRNSCGPNGRGCAESRVGHDEGE